MLCAALTTAPGRRATSDLAATTSMSEWSMTATSPGSSRLVRFLVRRSTRAGPVTPGPPSGTARRGIRSILTRRWSHGATGRRSTPLPPPLVAGVRGVVRGAPALGLRGCEQLSGVRLRRVRILHPAEHPGELADPTLLAERPHATHRHLAVPRLHHREVPVRVRRDLR